MAKHLQVPKELEKLIEKREVEKDRRAKAASRKVNERREKPRRKSDR